MQQIRKGVQKKSSHFVLICDESGIFNTIRVIKDKLGVGNKVFISLIYVIHSNILNPMFEMELKILEKRFLQDLLVHNLKIEPREYETIQEFIEAVMNSNTNSELRFSIAGNLEFVDYVSGVLSFLNIDIHNIKSEII